MLVIGSLSSCAPDPGAAPPCGSVRRVALVAQAVPGAAYVPCIDHLEEGWRDGDFLARRGRASFTLRPERAGSRSVTVVLEGACDVSDAVPTRPRAEGVRTALSLRSITPRYAGRLVDVFPGGCITYRFDFARGPHIALMEELETTVGLMSRRDLRLQLRRELSVELDP